VDDLGCFSLRETRLVLAILRMVVGSGGGLCEYWVFEVGEEMIPTILFLVA